MLKLWRRPDSKRGIWRIRGTIGGTRYDESTGTDSRAHAETIRVRREAEILDRLTFGPERTTCFSEAVEIYLSGGGEARFLEPLVRAFGPRRLAAITQADVIAFIAQRYARTGPHGINRQVFTPLIAVYHAAHRAGLGPPPAFQRPKSPRRQAIRYATDDDLARLLTHCRPELAAAILLMSLGAARASEACRVMPADVDWRAATVTLRRTKNGDPAVIQSGPVLMAGLGSLRGRPDDLPLFGYASRHSLNQAVGRACGHAGIDPPFSTHEVGRHAFAARLLAQGHTLLEVQRAGRWKSYRMVAETYGHLERSHVDAMVREAGANLVHVVVGGIGNVVPIKKLSG